MSRAQLGRSDERGRRPRSRRVRRISLQNIVSSPAVLAAMMPLAVLGVGVAFAVLVHEAAELLAVANGARAGSLRWPGG